MHFRANLEHLRGQAKTLLAALKKGDVAAAREHLPAARDLTKLKLADAQAIVARQHGFASWAIMVRHVEQLRALEGEWQIARLEIDGSVIEPEAMRILIDGDRFRNESPEGIYEGVFSIDAEASPPHFDIHFVSGPEAGNDSPGIYRIDGPDELTLCLGLVNSQRPKEFVTRPDRGHALETLRRISKTRPANVTGGTAPVEVAHPAGSEADFDVPLTAIYERLQGEWAAVELVTNGKRLPDNYLAHAKRTMTGNETKVIVGGQTMVHAKVRIDDSQTPVAIDYFNLLAKGRGTVTHGIMELAGEARFLMAPAGSPRPTAFTDPGTLSRWRRK